MKTEQEWLAMPRRELDAAIHELLTGCECEYLEGAREYVYYTPEQPRHTNIVPHYSTDLNDTVKLCRFDGDGVTALTQNNVDTVFWVGSVTNRNGEVCYHEEDDPRIAILLAFLEAQEEVAT